MHNTPEGGETIDSNRQVRVNIKPTSPIDDEENSIDEIVAKKQSTGIMRKITK